MNSKRSQMLKHLTWCDYHN